MSDLRLRIRNKIYTSGNHIVDTRNNNNSIIVMLGEMSSEKMGDYISEFLKDTLKSQIPESKISLINIGKDELSQLPQRVSDAVKAIDFNPMMKNELYISFVTLMDDELYESVPNIDISAIEEIKVNVLGGYSIEVFYDFYAIFDSQANYERRQNARKAILGFLDKDNGGLVAQKRVFHQACPGGDYYRTSKSITFMILVILTGKIDRHSVIGGVEQKTQDDNYTWTTFALFEKNLASLVIYEMINKLLENQLNGVETVSLETILQRLKSFLQKHELQLKKLASPADKDYLPIAVRKRKRELTLAEKAANVFKKDKIDPIEYIQEDSTSSINDLIAQQSNIFDSYIADNITDQVADEIIMELIKLCTVMSSINNSQNEALVLRSLLECKKELSVAVVSNDYYERKYNEILLKAKSDILDKIIKYFETHVNSYVEKVQKHWNSMNMEVNAMINDFAAFQDYFEGISDLVSDKSVNLLCSYDDILEKIDVHSVIKAINQNSEIFSNVLRSYYDNVQSAGEIAQRFGNRPIAPDTANLYYYLFSSNPVICPEGLRVVTDDYWFREHEIAILFTAKNNISDCNNLPFKV